MPSLNSANEDTRSAGADPNLAMVEIRSAGSMGKGLFATRDIPRGTRILAELPILAISTASAEQLDLPAFCTELRRLSREHVQRLDQLHHNPAHITLEAREKTRNWYKDEGITDSNGTPLRGKKLQDVSKATLKRFAIFLSNRTEMGGKSAHGSGVFPIFSRINHSCVPNVNHAYNPIIKRLRVYSVRDIQAGEQLTISYFDGACRTKAQRSIITENWGFTCNCSACTDPSTDISRQRMLDLDQRLAGYEAFPGSRLQQRRGQTPMGRMLAAFIPATPEEALHDAKELAKLLKEQGLVGMDLCKRYVFKSLQVIRKSWTVTAASDTHSYRDCSKYSLQNGSIQDAIDYAIMELEIERHAIGTETDHLRDEDLTGAEFWLMDLKQKQEKSR